MEKVKKILEVAADVAVLVKRVRADGKIDLNDTIHVVPFVQKLPAHIEAISAWKEAVAEIKAINVPTGLALVTFIDEKVKLVERA
jgi:hypothetical protein